jgi:molybdopterin-guanine dinucleotide biosynthesis protein B
VNGVKALQIVGRKKVGKTTFIARLIPLLRERGLRVATVKHTRNPYPLDRPGTDSQRHRDAGAEATLVLTASQGALYFDAPEDPAAGEQLIARLLGEFDLVIIEGWRERPGPRVEIVAVDGQGRPDLLAHPDPGDLLAMVLGLQAPREWAERGAGAASARPEMPERPGVPVLAWEDVAGVGELVVRWVAGG